MIGLRRCTSHTPGNYAELSPQQSLDIVGPLGVTHGRGVICATISVVLEPRHCHEARRNTLINVQLVQERQRVIESLEKVLVVFDHLATHVDAKPLLVHEQLIAIEHVS